MVRTKLVPKRRWPPKENLLNIKERHFCLNKKTIEIKKNGEVVRTVTV